MPCANHPEVENGLEYCCRCGTRLCPDCLVTLEGNRFCLGCKEEQVRDLLSGSAPSGLELASLGSRALALLIDGFILFTPQILLWGVLIGGMVLAEELLPADEATQMLVMIPMYLFLFVFAMISGMLPMAYEGLLVWKRAGQTFGKQLVGIRVVTPEGQPPSGSQAWLRAVLRFMLMNFCYGIVDYLPAFFDEERKTIHDLAAKTRVVRVRR
ncbi:MAG: RDD family protein [Myxococcota bacterium]|jgi:uncharacterized RDD family membrane protein YckC|nr:RDD family protein [Myxococcota bacterium]